MFLSGNFFVSLIFRFRRGYPRLMVHALGFFKQACLLLLAECIGNFRVGWFQRLDGERNKFNSKFFIDQSLNVRLDKSECWLRKGREFRSAQYIL